LTPPLNAREPRSTRKIKEYRIAEKTAATKICKIVSRLRKKIRVTDRKKMEKEHLSRKGGPHSA